MRHFTRLRARFGKQDANEAENAGAHQDGGDDGANHEGSPSAYLNLDFGAEEVVRLHTPA